MPYRLRMFGGWDLLGPDGEPIDAVRAHRSKGAALLAYLATRPPGQPAQRGDLYPLLWPERNDEAAGNALRSALSRLRRKLPEGAVGGKDENRAWVDDSVLTSDVRAFGRAVEEGRRREALRLYRGPFLDHVRLTAARPFNRWADEQRESYRRQAYEAALALGERAREDGAFSEAEKAYRKALDLAPLKEEAAAGLMRVLAARGERAETLQLYERFTDRLRQELDLVPSADLKDLAERVRAGDQTAEAGGREVDAEEVAGRGEPAESRWLRRPLVVVVALLAAVLLGAGTWLLLLGGSGTAASSSASVDRPTVAVLPFGRLGADGDGGEESVFREGTHLGLINRLSNISDLAVVSRTAVRPYGEVEESLTAIADTLGAQWIVRGDVQEFDGRVQVNVRLINPRAGTQVWAGEYRRKLTPENLFAIESEVTKRIAQSLEGQLSQGETERVQRRPTEDMEAYKFYVQGRSYFAVRTEAGVRKAVEYFQRAIDEDSSYARAWAGLADAIAVGRARGLITPGDSLPEVERAARRALQLEPDLAEAHASMGMVHFHQQSLPLALRELKRAIALKPSYAQAHDWLGMTLLAIGRPEDAHRYNSTAVQLSPRHVAARARLVTVLIELDSISEAKTHLRGGLLLPGKEARLRGRILYYEEQWEELEQLARKRFERQGPYNRWRFYLARIALLRADTATARDQLTELRKERALFEEGLVRAALGATDSAFAAWRKIEDWSGFAIWDNQRLRYSYDDILDPLRGDPRYEELVGRINRQYGLNPDGSLPDSVDVSFGSESDD